jgi:hypothetical protein
MSTDYYYLGGRWDPVNGFQHLEKTFSAYPKEMVRKETPCPDHTLSIVPSEDAPDCATATDQESAPTPERASERMPKRTTGQS